MNKEEIFKKLATVLEKNSKLPANAVKLGDKLKVYVPPAAILSFALEIDNAFPKVNLTDLTNSLYDPIATVGDLVNYISEVYDG
jgi:hypothetical protein